MLNIPQIWRCYKVWGNSLRVIFLPLVLVVAEACKSQYFRL